jgi:ubiquinone/menaquinone biosynthesis C-methylase UbiE
LPEAAEHNRKIVEQHTRQASGYARLTGAMAGRASTSRPELLGATSNDVVLDIACGPGSLTLELAPHVARAIGLDITPAMLDEARAAQTRRGVDNVEWINGDAAKLPFADGSFTLVASSAAFHHFAAPAKVLAEMARVCRPGGRVAVMDVTPDAGKTEAYDRMERMRDPSHGHAHSVAELMEMGRNSGLDAGEASTSITGPLPFDAILETSFPEDHSRKELLEMMREDAQSGEDRLGFRARLEGGSVLVSYPLSTIVWTKR